MTEFYEEIGLPVWVIESYAELISHTESDLQNRYEELLPKFDAEALRMSYWAKRIESGRHSATSQSLNF